MKSNQEIVEKAREYLLRFPEISPEVLDSQLKFPEANKPKNIEDLFQKMLFHATNRQGYANYIGTIASLKQVLFSFSSEKVLKSYPKWEDLFDAVQNKVNPPGRMDKQNNKNSWVLFSKAILSIAEYVDRFSSIKSFYSYVDQFLSTNADVRLGLPLIISQEVQGFGFALACDFIKENLSPLYVKPDTHLRDIFIGIGISKQNSTDYQIFRDIIDFSHDANMVPYEVDKLFWLIGSGNFYNENIRIKTNKVDFIEKVKDM